MLSSYIYSHYSVSCLRRRVFGAALRIITVVLSGAGGRLSLPLSQFRRSVRLYIIAMNRRHHLDTGRPAGPPRRATDIGQITHRGITIFRRATSPTSSRRNISIYRRAGATVRGRLRRRDCDALRQVGRLVTGYGNLQQAPLLREITCHIAGIPRRRHGHRHPRDDPCECRCRRHGMPAYAIT